MAKRKKKQRARARQQVIGRQVVRKPRGSVMIAGRSNRANVNYFPTQRVAAPRGQMDDWMNRSAILGLDQRQREQFSDVKSSMRQGNRSVAQQGSRDLDSALRQLELRLEPSIRNLVVNHAGVGGAGGGRGGGRGGGGAVVPPPPPAAIAVAAGAAPDTPGAVIRNIREMLGPRRELNFD